MHLYTTTFRSLSFAIILVLAMSHAVLADLRLPKVIGSHMVLQREKPLQIWGWADKGEKVSVECAGNKATATANDKGEWLVTLPAMNAGGPHTLTVSGNNTVTLTDILVGEVWIGSGQSNMEWSVSRTNDAKNEIAAAEHPNIRLFLVPKTLSGIPKQDVKAEWKACSPTSVPSFSAVLYFFGRTLQQELDVPVGLIASSWGGSRIEPWTPPVGFAGVESLSELSDDVRDLQLEYLKGLEQGEKKVDAEWLKTAKAATAKKALIQPAPGVDFPGHPLGDYGSPTAMFNAMIHPLVPFTVRGAIWYQGEANLSDGMLYAEKTKALVEGWRTVWNDDELSFYWAQLAPFTYGGDPLQLPRIWEAQTMAMSIPKTGMAVITDIGNLTDIHPRNKQDVGRRLALCALAKDYGKDLIYSGPLYKSMKVEGSKLRVSFDHVGEGLETRDGEPLNGFEIAAGDGGYIPAKAVIDGKTVVLSSDKVKNPTAVRFAWHQLAEPNLRNTAGLMANAFRTTATTPTITGSPLFVDYCTVELACTESDGVIRYTTDGSTPTDKSAVYTKPLKLTVTTSVKARFYRNTGMKSVVATMVVENPDGKLGKALNLDGRSHTVKIPHYAGLKPDKAITVSAWIKPERVGKGGWQWQEIFRKEDGNARVLFAIGEYEKKHSLCFGLGIGGKFVELGAPLAPAKLLDGKWHLVSVTFDGKAIKFYADGQEIGAKTATGSIDTQGEAPAYIGSDRGTREFFKGGIDDVRVYNRALSTGEIKAMALADGKATVDGIVGWWKLDGDAKNSAANFLDSATTSHLNKDKILQSLDWLQNQDFDWYKDNIPFLETPDKEIDATYYYRWELVTRHICYGSPASGYSLTEFANRPSWSGAYGAIACPSGHQFNEIRWMHNPRVARDYLRYWFRTKGAQPRKYSSWMADSAWAVHQVHPNKAFIIDLFPDLVKNFKGWEARHWVKDMNMFWQTGHDDGMEFNINSRQTKDILRGDRAFRPSFNSYMWADATALAKISALDEDQELEKEYRAIAANLKKQIQEKLWDPKRNFFFPMSSQEETDKEGNVVKAHTLTYQSGKFAGSPHGRELHGYVPWAFNIPDPDFTVAWQYLMDPEYFLAPYGPRTTEVNDPLYVLKTGCCWWSGQSWPFATAQTLKAMGNLLQFYEQDQISKEDYLTVLHTFAISQRKDGKPYIAEALNPDDGSWRGHDMRNRSEHYFHSSFNDQIITGLIGLQPADDTRVVIDPLAPESWDYFAMESIPYKGHMISVLWDKKGDRYGAGKGFHVFIDGKKIKSTESPRKVTIALPSVQEVPMDSTIRFNYAVNNDGDYYPRYTASFIAKGTSLSKVYDGEYVYDQQPANRWTSYGSKQEQDWLMCDLGEARTLDTLKLYIIDDGKEVLAPRSFTCEYWKGEKWVTLPGQKRFPEKAAGKRANTVTFPALRVRKLRFVFQHAPDSGSGLTELQAWGPGRLPYTPPRPPKGNMAINPTNQGYPKATASYSDRYGGVAKSTIDGKIMFQATPVNRWTSYGSPNKTDWLEVDFGEEKVFKKVVLHIYDDHGGVQTPSSYTIQTLKGSEWTDVQNIQKDPAELRGSSENIATFEPRTSSRIRVVFTHKGNARSGLTEIEVW